jgi:aldose 1-epimerase
MAAMMEISAGPLAIGVAPEIGGSLAFFRMNGIDAMRPLSPADAEAKNVLGAAMFPMVPYANRIAGNAFDFGGRTWRFEPNNPPDRINAHGSGWKSAWNADRDDDGIRLSLDHIASDEPYSYRAVQHFALDAEKLTVCLQLTNAGPVAMPFGFGLHPWFERSPATALAFGASRFLMEGPGHVPTDWISLPPELDFADSGPLPDTWRNNDYGDWYGEAEIRFPERGLGLTIMADPVFDHLMLYADRESPHFCLEPQSHAPCAFNRMSGRGGEAFGAHVLAPGESLEGKIRFRPFSL